MKRFVFIPLVFLLCCSACFSQTGYEFRAVWIASVDNIDWPSKGNYNPESQKADFIRQLDMHQHNGINAVIVQIRPAADAFYPSPYEPWSEWLTGKQGQAPVPYYDPLQFMIDETHKRGMEFHAWCNPYRAVFKIGQSSIAANHVTRTHPDWFLTYGTTKYFDPGNKDVQAFVTKVIRDIVKRYDIDAIHFDDYFYPYRIPGKEFPDEASFRKYGNGLSKEDWRRSNVDSIIVMLSKTIKSEKKYCRFGISPFGVWRNNTRDPEGSATKAGQTNYDDLYADILLWLQNGWIDYVAPQLYWEIGQRVVPFEVLLDWWGKHSYARHCYVGLGIYKAGSTPPWKDKTQIPRQIQAIRGNQDVQGMIFFSSTSFQKNPNGWCDSLRENYFRAGALTPPMPWIDSVKPVKPVINFDVARSGSRDGDSLILTASLGQVDTLSKGIAVYLIEQDKSASQSPELLRMIYRSGSSADLTFTIPANEINDLTKFGLVVKSVSKSNVESDASNIIWLRADGNVYKLSSPIE